MPDGPPGGIYANEIFQHARGTATVFIPTDTRPRAVGRAEPYTDPARWRTEIGWPIFRSDWLTLASRPGRRKNKNKKKKRLSGTRNIRERQAVPLSCANRVTAFGDGRPSARSGGAATAGSRQGPGRSPASRRQSRTCR